MTDFNFLTAHVGSVPYPVVDGLTEKLADLLSVAVLSGGSILF